MALMMQTVQYADVPLRSGKVKQVALNYSLPDVDHQLLTRGQMVDVITECLPILVAEIEKEGRQGFHFTMGEPRVAAQGTWTNIDDLILFEVSVNKVDWPEGRDFCEFGRGKMVEVVTFRVETSGSLHQTPLVYGQDSIYYRGGVYFQMRLPGGGSGLDAAMDEAMVYMILSRINAVSAMNFQRTLTEGKGKVIPVVS